mgnify:FL=1|jgi:hypothetical protein
MPTDEYDGDQVRRAKRAGWFGLATSAAIALVALLIVAGLCLLVVYLALYGYDA